MKKTEGEIEGEISEPIPNPSGIPGKGQVSEDIREGHREWKKHIKEAKIEKTIEHAYWRRASNCTYF